MAFSIEQFIAAHRFEWKTDSLGKILVHNFSSKNDSMLRKAFESYINADSKTFVKQLITTVCQLDSNNSGVYTDERVTLEQVEKLNDKELNEFACRYIEKNSYLMYDYNKKASKRKRNEEDNVEKTVQNEKRTEAIKQEGESYCDVLKRLMHHHRVYEEEQRQKLFDSLKPRNIFSDSLLGLIDDNRKLSSSLENELFKYKTRQLPELYKPPENPVHETNRQLAGLGKEISKTSSLIKSMNDLGLQMAVEMASNSKTSQLHNTLLISIGLLTLSFSAIMSYLSYTSSVETADKMQDILIKINVVQESIANDQKKNNETAYSQLLEINKTLSKISKEKELSLEKPIINQVIE